MIEDAVYKSELKFVSVLLNPILILREAAQIRINFRLESSRFEGQGTAWNLCRVARISALNTQVMRLFFTSMSEG